MSNVARKLNNNSNKFVIRDTEHLIDVLRSIMPISKEIAILNIEKYGYKVEKEYILNSLGFSISKKSKLKIKKEVEKQAEIFNLIFSVYRECYIRLRNKKTGEYRSYNVQALQDPYRLQAIINSKYFSNTIDLMYSLNCYNNMYTCNENTLFSLQNFALDIDFPLEKYTIKQVKNILKNLWDSGAIPVPNLLEYGHRVRVIYSIEDVAVKKGSKKAINLIKKVGETINNKIPEDLNSSVQALTTYGRINGSINSKDNSKVKIDVLNPKKYVLRDLQNTLLEVPEWKKKLKKANKNSKIVSFKNSYTLNLARVRDLEKIQSIREKGYRELLCYLYRNYLLLLNIDNTEVWEKLKEFNNNFKNPLKENKLDGDTKHLNRKQYLHKSETILKLLDITEEEEKKLNLETICSELETRRRKIEGQKKKYIEKLHEQGKLTKVEQNNIIRAKIKSLKIEGFKNREIAQELNLPVKTVERHITYLKKNGLL